MPATTPPESSPDRSIEDTLVKPMDAVLQAVDELRDRVTGPEIYSSEMAFEAVAHLTQTLQPLLDRLEAEVLEAGKDCGGTWTRLGQAYEPELSRAAVQARYRRFGGTKSWQQPRGGLPVTFDMTDTGEL